MKAVILSPFGSVCEEAGLVYLVANYLKTVHPDVTSLRCNGLFSLCDRDSEAGWKRTITSCLECSRDQRSFADWARIGIQDLSPYLTPAEARATYEEILRLRDEDLLKLEFQDKRLFDLYKGTFKNKFGIETPDLNHKGHVQALQRLSLATMRLCLAIRRFNVKEMPSYLFVTGGTDFITNTAMWQSGLQDRSVVLFQWSLEQRCVNIIHPNKQTALSCELVLSGLAQMRSDSKTWSPEILEIIRGILQFLDIPERPVQIKVAQ